MSRLEAAHEAHDQASRSASSSSSSAPYPGYPSGRSWDEASGRLGTGKTMFRNTIPGAAVRSEAFHVAIVTPVIHCCLGGLETSLRGEVINQAGASIRGLYAAGEVIGGVCSPSLG